MIVLLQLRDEELLEKNSTPQRDILLGVKYKYSYVVNAIGNPFSTSNIPAASFTFSSEHLPEILQ